MEIYTLTDKQHHALKVSAEHGKPVVVPELNTVCTLEERIEQEQQIKLLTDLVDLGLMMNVTSQHEETNASIREQYGNGFLFFLVSPDGYAMFKRENLVVN